MPLLTDLRFGLRFLTRSPGFFALSSITLALGIAIATLMFSFTESVLWRPLPLPAPERLVHLSKQEIKNPANDTSASAADFLDWRARALSFSSLSAAAWSAQNHILTGSGERVRSLAVAAGFFETLGVRPTLGRAFVLQEEAPTARVAMLTDAFWRDHFHASRDAIGQTLQLDRETYSVVGVLPADFRLADVLGIADPGVFVPMNLSDTQPRRGYRALAVVGRLKSGVSMDEAAIEMHAIAARIAADNPKFDGGWDVRLQDLREAFTQYNRTILYLFLGFSILVLLIASANVAGLELVRAVGRQREYALRLALGAGSGALHRQAFAEALWIALPSSLAGMLFASWGIQGIRAIMPPDFLVRADQIALDYRVLLFVVAVSLSITVGVSLAPAFLAAGSRIEAALRAGSKTVTAPRRTQLLLNTLIAAEMTLSLVLLFAAGLFLASNSRLQQEALGFNPNNILTVTIAAGGENTNSAPRQSLLYTNAMRRAQSIGGVRQVAVASAAPLSGGAWLRYTVGGQTYARVDEQPQSLVRVVSPGYFQLLSVPLLLGRSFAPLDNATAPRVAIVNENFAKSAFAGQNPIGRTFEIHSDDASIPTGPVEIIGLAANTHELGLSEVAFQDVFLPFAQNPQRTVTLLAKTAGSVAPIVASLKEELHKLDPDCAVYNASTFDATLASQFRAVRFRMSIVSLFAGLAVVLAAVGIYGTIAFSVAQRTREFALRIALGAVPNAIRRAALGRTSTLTAVAAAAGITVCLILGELLKSELYLVPRQHSGVLFGVGVHDPMTLAAAAAILIAMATSASLIPASRAAKVDPAAQLRND